MLPLNHKESDGGSRLSETEAQISDDSLLGNPLNFAARSDGFLILREGRQVLSYQLDL
jgi:hypothetical protein